METRLLDSCIRGARVVLAAMLGLSCAGCAADPGVPAAVAAPSQAPSQETSPNVNTVPAPMLEAALEDVVRRASVKRDDIEVVTAEAVTWSDGSAGCPQPGMMYTQALVPGYRIVLRAGTQVFNYHAGRSGTPRFCPAEQVTPPVSGGNDRI